MKQFSYLTADSFEAASKALTDSGNAVVKAAGTDLLDLLKERIVEPDEVVNLLRVEQASGTGVVSALATLADVAADAAIAEDYPALQKSAAVAATPAVRNFATVGGNLCQHTRCWYFRNEYFPCFKRGSAICPPLEKGGQNRYNAVFSHERCASAHPSNLAPALIALGAKVRCVHPEGGRTLSVEELYREPRNGRIGDTVLRKGELIRSVHLEPSALTRNSTYLEFRERHSFDFALVSVAAAVRLEGSKVAEARIVLGAVAPIPYRAKQAEQVLTGKPLNSQTAQAAAEAALAGAQPLSQNAYKVPIAKTLIRRALMELSS